MNITQSNSFTRDYILKRWENYPPLPETTRILIAFVMIATLVVGLIGNSIVLALFVKYKSLRTVSNIIVINLTVADLLMCVFCMPIIVMSCIKGRLEQDFEYIMCNYEAFMGAITGFISIWSLTALAANRCAVLTRQIPIQLPKDKRIAYITVVFIWIFSALGASFPFFGFGRYVLEGSGISCTFDYFDNSYWNLSYIIAIQLLYFFIPLLCIVCSYTVIYLNVRKHEKKYFCVRKNGCNSDVLFRRMNRRRRLERIELKAAKAGVILVFLFVISWLPYCVISLVGLFGDSSGLTPLAVGLPALFAKLSTMLNPVFYALVDRKFNSKLFLTTCGAI